MLMYQLAALNMPQNHWHISILTYCHIKIKFR